MPDKRLCDFLDQLPPQVLHIELLIRYSSGMISDYEKEEFASFAELIFSCNRRLDQISLSETIDNQCKNLWNFSCSDYNLLTLVPKWMNEIDAKH